MPVSPKEFEALLAKTEAELADAIEALHEAIETLDKFVDADCVGDPPRYESNAALRTQSDLIFLVARLERNQDQRRGVGIHGTGCECGKCNTTVGR